MPDVDEGQFVAVPVGPCRCSGGANTHPDGDVVWLAPKPGVEMALAAEGALRRSGRKPGDVDAALGSVFLRYGIRKWTFINSVGPVLINPDTIDEWLPWDKGGYEVADKADDLYAGTVLAPLLKRSAPPQPPTPAPPSTSPISPSGPSSRTSPSPSSPSTPEAGK